MGRAAAAPFLSRCGGFLDSPVKFPSFQFWEGGFFRPFAGGSGQSFVQAAEASAFLAVTTIGMRRIKWRSE
ncbi:MAG: hypothetical protein DBX55_04730 [Verrucomicrobia bacterium]|nr:MAG: hypothetical protein DBX55_04730 [Verrucomicrobiota bacterium]